MKKSNFICLASIFSLAFVNVSQAQIDVQSNGAVKVGNLDKTTHLSGSSLEVAVSSRNQTLHLPHQQPQRSLHHLQQHYCNLSWYRRRYRHLLIQRQYDLLQPPNLYRTL